MTTTQPPSITCALVGADSLLIECGEILLGKGHRIEAVAAGSPRVAAWARAKGVKVVDATAPATQWQGALAQVSFEWLLAITHLAILPDHVLALPTKGAVNFHDGPLPEYAGLNTPAWALLNGEREHGISWHMITSGVDDGDVLKQRRFEIASAETSLSLNTRNFEAAIETFDELVDELASGTYTLSPQDRLSARRTFARDDRPEALAMLDWRQPAAGLERTVRALDFGRYPNPLGCAKLMSATGALVVIAATAIDDGEAAKDFFEPGTVIIAEHDRLVVACGRGALAITALTTLTGEPCSPDRAAAELGLVPGSRLRVLNDVTRAAWSVRGRRLAAAERYHLPQLRALAPIEVPWAATPETGHESRFETVGIEVPADIAADDGLVVGSFGVLLARLSGKDHFHIALSAADAIADFRLLAPLTATAIPFAVTVTPHASIGWNTAEIADALTAARSRAPYAVELVARTPDLAAVPELVAGRSLPVAVVIDADDASSSPSDTALAGDRASGVVVELCRTDGRWRFEFDATLVRPADAKLLAIGLESVIRSLVADPALPVASVDLLGPELRRRILEEWNATVVDHPVDACIHHAFEHQVDRTPDVTAVIFEDQTISYRQLDESANQLAFLLIELGVGPDHLVGVHVGRGIDLLRSVLAVHKAGGAYVPLDPVYPPERLEHMIRDSHCRVILTDAMARDTLPVNDDPSIVVVRVDADRYRYDGRPTVRPDVVVQAHHLAYCIYTSGSTGLPKGVLVEHDNVNNFFVGMDDVVAHELPATWFAVTSLSFDISVLELLYTLTRGFTVVVYLDRDRAVDEAPAPNVTATTPSRVDGNAAASMEFSLFYFSGDEADGQGADKYRLLLEGAKWADEHSFCAVWTPERHFHAFGGLYPQPAVTSAAIAAITTHVGIRAGSVVMPLHHPIRVAEAWGIVDNISNGRVAISFASGWQPNDFVLMPENFGNAKQAMFDGIDVVKRLWRGERVAFDGATGSPVEITTLPRPVQPELPVWITTAGNPETYAQAGRIGANVLTHLLGQSVEQLAPKIALYRKARADAGFDPDAGIVSLMLHTFAGDDEDAVREMVRGPLKQYLGTSFSLLKEYAWAFPAFQRPTDVNDGGGLADEDFKQLSAEDLDAVLEFAFLRYYETSGLFGTVERCQGMVHRLTAIGVNEIACLIDFGVDTDTVLASLPHLDELRRHSDQRPSTPGTATTVDGPQVDVGADSRRAADERSPNDQSVAAQLSRHGVTHLQCTPSMARMLSMQDESRAALAAVEHLFIGGEAFPVALAKDLQALSGSGRITNMYGPTETTIWSTTWPLAGEQDTIPIGAPIANTQVYILDKHRQPLPPGVAGELWIGGRGVVRGYHDRSELTAERFVPDPFRGNGQRMYATGDLARWREHTDGSAIVEFLGRSDHQVKIRGYRIELGEIEAQLGTYPGVVECVVAVREDAPGDQQLVAYVSASGDAIVDPTTLKARLRQHLPEVMVPAHVAVLAELPHTPNGKIDRNGLPSLAEVLGSRGRRAEPVAAANELERRVLIVWEETLGTTGVSVDDNFFDVGGHSLLVVRMHRRLKDEFDSPIPLTDLYRFPTVRGFAAALASDGGAAVVQGGLDRAARRRDRMRRR